MKLEHFDISLASPAEASSAECEALRHGVARGSLGEPDIVGSPENAMPQERRVDDTPENFSARPNSPAKVIDATQAFPKAHAQPTIFFDRIGYCSLSEAACGVLLQLYVPGFKVIEGRTYQVPFGNGRSVDFVVDDFVFEYHQPRFFPERRRYGDFRDGREYSKFIEKFNRLRSNPRQAAKLVKETEEQLVRNYYEKRRAQLDEHPLLSELDLVVAGSPGEFHSRVIQQYQAGDSPSADEFLEIFRAIVRNIARANPTACRKRAARREHYHASALRAARRGR